MEELRECVEWLTELELERANKTNKSKFNSMHEGYAVILEEVEEVKEEFELLKIVVDGIWNSIRRNNTKVAIECMESLKKRAVYLSCEAIQVAAMSEKFKDSFE